MSNDAVYDADVSLKKLGQAVLLLSSGLWASLSEEQEDHVDNIAVALAKGADFSLEMRADLLQRCAASRVFDLIGRYVRNMV